MKTLNWDEYALKYNNLQILPAYQELLKLFLKFIKKYKKDFDKLKVLDVGCGTGALSFMIGNKYPESKIFSIDANKEMLTRAKLDKPESLNISFEYYDINDISEYGEKDFDLIVMNNVLYTLKNKSEILLALTKLLKTDGILIFSDPQPPNEYSYLKVVLDGFTVGGIIKILRIVPDLLFMYKFNLKIDKVYERLNKKMYLDLFNSKGLKLLDTESSYAKQANIFVIGN